MALLFCDGFDHIDETNDCWKIKFDGDLYGTDATFVNGYGRDGGWGFRTQGQGLRGPWYSFPTMATIIIGHALKFQTANPTAAFLRLQDGSSVQIEFRMDVAGYISVYRNTTLLGTTSIGVANPLDWCYFEAKVVFSSTVGSVVLRVNGAEVLTLTGVDTANTANEYCNIVRIWCTGGGTYVDDLYICDTTGTVNNDFLGDVKITTLYPIADGNSSDFTPSTGTDHYAVVDDPQLAADTDHLTSTTVGHKETFGMTTLEDVSSILGVQVTAAVSNTDAGTINVRPVARSGATPADNEGSDFALSQTIKGAMHIFEQEPTDAVDWTTANINSAEFGIKIQS